MANIINKPMTNSNIVQLTINNYWALVFIGVGVWRLIYFEIYV